ncbi:M28 family peptidase [Thalassoglobus polymorphus]|uniref:Aminopeptidase YwaD n=1 Tax=Thalassoglobus polymorphus TaxID=2527994 RepID=A0A517QLP9_9PLAN|nr:M28 family peptidase [Thalassoglobus polymorphus]QDT32560.1 Aminopeptidase YwaD precursor [Thalassoglobus polymorphus]
MMSNFLQRILLVPFCLLVIFSGHIAINSLYAEDASKVAAKETSEAERRLLDDVKKLASDEWEGRGVGTEGLKKAAKFIAESFRDAGLDVSAAGGDPFQEFEIVDGAKLGSPNSLTLTGPDGKTISLEMGKNFEVCSFGGSGKIEGELVFAGYGIVATDLEYDEYDSIDVKDKIVIVMRRNPKQSDPHGPFAVGHGISRHAGLTTKLSRAFSNGAKGVIFVNDPYTVNSEKEQLEEQVEKAAAQVSKLEKENGDKSELETARTHLSQVKEILAKHVADKLMEFGYGGTRSGKSPATFHISQDVCNEILKPTLGKTLSEIEAQIDETGEPFSRPLEGWKVSGQAALKIIRVPVKNVIGVLEGQGPHSDETIVIGAHFDHLGRGGAGSLAANSTEIHNGADDNASGTAGLMEIARRLGERKDPLPRRVVFIAFNGEERGLLGANEYVDNPIFPLEKTVAMFNMDMIGRLDENKLTIFGTGTSKVWDAMLDKSTEGTGIELIKKTEGFGPSDHAAFYGKKIPVLHFFTGIHEDYHRPGDDWEKLNVPGMAKIIEILEKVVLETAEAEVRPDYISIPGTASLARSGSRPYFGSIPDFGENTEGYAISGVSPGSPADKGKLKGGDVIVELDGRKIGGLDDFDLALRDFRPGQQISVTVQRDSKKVELKVTLGTPKN